MGAKRSGPGTRLSLVPDATGVQVEVTELIDGSAVVGSGMSDYALLRTGKINLDEYLELTVDRTVVHLEGQLPEEQIEAMREVLRFSLQNDPQLVAFAARLRMA